jgi:hypothetical protein
MACGNIFDANVMTHFFRGFQRLLLPDSPTRIPRAALSPQTLRELEQQAARVMGTCH